MKYMMISMLMFGGAALGRSAEEGRSTMTQKTQAQSVCDFSAKDIDGKGVALADYQGKVLLIVNVASK
ncbi:MAG: hypothetical protein ACE5E5_02155 [Phycisphaerae bacterium]